ncbi:hypothetical protein GLA29479_4371 [Lysobacter antibioticus]|uniref:Uncharacterized protein n=1 Tax=Lysobacter antibioticus TaxID=84531 RepID=A0A0S2E3W8_LYSAN|nr:hypothetical protein GLA29479_4371 [Lysobacter antibioticus]ALN79622.1 hypothetical protein LA76x_1466 [Lysobacter antibioticus]
MYASRDRGLSRVPKRIERTPRRLNKLGKASRRFRADSHDL